MVQLVSLLQFCVFWELEYCIQCDQFGYSLFNCGTDAEIFGNLMIASAAVANFQVH
jgi:hypothetical protein